MSENNFKLWFQLEDIRFELPINPETLPVSRETENGEYNVLGLGPIMVPRTPKQRVVSISSLFPGRPLPGMLTTDVFKPPEYYIVFFADVMSRGLPVMYTPVRYHEDGTLFRGGDDGGFRVLVTAFNTEERGGETGDFYYELTLTEYRDYTPQTFQLQTQSAGEPAVATAEASRSAPSGQLYVGCAAIANGPFYSSSYGDGPHGNGNGRRVLVSRMVDAARAYPVHVTTESGGALGWMKSGALQVTT